MLDIDNWPLPGWADLADDPGTWIDAAIHELLPPAFHDAECWWQLSLSAGFVTGRPESSLVFLADRSRDERPHSACPEAACAWGRLRAV